MKHDIVVALLILLIVFLLGDLAILMWVARFLVGLTCEILWV